MYITIDILQQRGACQEYLDYFMKHYPDGVEMLHMIEKGHMPYHGLHWGYKWLNPNKEEIAAYWKAVHVENSEGVDESDHISNSSLIVNSSHISDSEQIVGCEEISGSREVRISKYVTNSKNIDNSSYIDDSTRILNGQNITNSSEVVDSTYIVDSNSIYESDNIVDSKLIWHSKNLTNCYFCFKCHNTSNAMFCLDQVDGEYLLFNKPIDKMRFDMIKKQFNRYATVNASMTENWSLSLHKNGAKKINNYQLHTKHIPDAFWNWVKTLPGYDPSILYSLTFNQSFLV